MLKAFAGGRLFGEVAGEPPPRVLALHGWARTHADFRAVLEGYGAVALDLPGFGASPPPDAGWGAAAYAECLAGVLPELGSPLVVLGHSFGGRVAVHLAASRPEAVSALVLAGVPLLRPAGAKAGAPPLAYRAVRRLHRLGLVGDGPMERLRQRYGSADYRRASGVMRDVLVRAVSETYEHQLRAIRCPVELVWGDDDPQVPLEVAERAVAMLGGRATLTVVPGAGHDTPRTAMSELRAALGRALSMAGSASASASGPAGPAPASGSEASSSASAATSVPASGPAGTAT